MSDRLYQHRRQLPLDAAHPESIAEDIAAAIRDLETQAETRPLPVALDWSQIDVKVTHSTLADTLVVIASAPVL